MHSGTVLFFNKISTSVHIFIYLKINKLSINILKTVILLTIFW